MRKIQPILFVCFLFPSLFCKNKTEKYFAIPGVIFTKEQTEADFPYPVGDLAWTPSELQIYELEQKLASFIQSNEHPQVLEIVNKLASYRRQYLGFSENGKKMIFVNAFCESFASRNDDWRSKFVLVFDGGICFFQAVYDPETKNFVRLQVNGVA